MITLEFVDLPEDDPNRERFYSEHLYCPYDDLSFEELEPRSFSFNSPFGACPECTGLGTKMEVDPDLVVPDPERTPPRRRASTRGPAATPANTSSGSSRRSADTMGFTLDTPVGEAAPRRHRSPCCSAHDEQVHVRYSNRYGRQRSYYTDLRGRHPVGPAPARRGRERLDPRAVRGLHAGDALPGLQGRQAQAGHAGRHGRATGRIAEVSAMSIGECADVPRRLELSDREHADRRAGASRRSTPGWASCSTSASTT